MPLTVGSLFAGIGGFDLGFERAGMVCKWQVEIDPFCQRVLAKHWPNVRRWDDVRTFPPEPIDEWRVDVLCGGFPCQDISIAGKGKGLTGERSGLWFEFERIIRTLRPNFVVVENVPALLVRGFERVLGDLATLGYDAEWDVLSACTLGAPHTRKRLFIISYPHSMFRKKGMGINPNKCQRIQQRDARTMQDNWLASVTTNSRSADGIPDWSHRCTGLGNSVVPQIAEWIGKRIVRFANE